MHCHSAVIDLSLLWEDAGVEVEILDEGEYWPGPDTRVLRERVGFLNRITAGLAGALKDAANESGGPPVASAIFEHPDFERLEAEAAEAHADQVRQSREAIEKTQLNKQARSPGTALPRSRRV